MARGATKITRRGLAAMTALASLLAATPSEAATRTVQSTITNFVGVRLPLRNYTPGQQVVVPDPWGRTMRLKFASFAAPAFHGGVFLTVEDDEGGLQRESRINADSFPADGSMVLIWQQILDPAGRLVWKAPRKTTPASPTNRNPAFPNGEPSAMGARPATNENPAFARSGYPQR